MFTLTESEMNQIINELENPVAYHPGSIDEMLFESEFLILQNQLLVQKFGYQAIVDDLNSIIPQ